MAKESAREVSAGEVSVADVIQETRFFDVSLNDAGILSFDESIGVAEAFRSELKQLQMLVLGGHKFEDKAIFARHLAWHLRTEIGASIPVKQWHPGLARWSFDEALRQFKSQSILLFPSVFPHHFGHDLRRLYEEVCEHKHFAIVSTDSNRDDWGGLEVLETRLWKEPETTAIYPPAFLAGMLRKELGETGKTWSDGSLETLAGRLRTPSRVRIFVRLVRAETGPVDPAWVEEVLEQLHGNGHAVGRWYRQLEQRHQSLALGLALLEGVSRDQALAAMDVVTTRVWRPRDPNFKAPDSFDLPPLGAYFAGIGEGARTSVLTCHAPEYRRAILKAAWECHEREVLAILPILARIASDSGSFASGPMEFRPGTEAPEGSRTAEPQEKEKAEEPKSSRTFASWRLPHGVMRDLFGSPERVQQIQTAVSSSLSEMGKISFDAVDNLLLQLAASQEPAARSVAAAALARWREPEDDNPELHQSGEDRLFDTLERWCSEAFDLEIENLVELRITDAFAHVRSTVALAVSFAALFDARNQLAPRLRALFEALAQDSRDIVRASFRNHTLPWITALHLGQIETFLQDTIALEIDSLSGLSVGLAAAARIQPREALPLIDRWYQEGLAARAPRRGKIPPAKKRLAAAALAYGCIAADDLAPRECPRAEALRRMRRVYAQEKKLRWVIVEAMKVQLWRNLEGNEATLRDLLEELTPRDRSALVSPLVALHEKERETLPGSDMRCVILGQEGFKVWTHPGRPLTQVEKVLKGWLLEGTSRPVVRLAARALATISDRQVEVEERKLREKKAHERDLRKKSEQGSRTLREQIQETLGRKEDPEAQSRAREELARREAALRARPLSGPSFLTPLLCSLAALLATCFSPRDRVVVREQLAGLLEHWQSSISIMTDPREWLARVFGRYGSDQEDLDTIAGHLARAAWLFRFRWLLAAASGSLVLVLGLQACS
jgi:hypothetical protein